MPVLSVEDLRVEYEVNDGAIQAVRDVSFDIEENTIVGLLGESGCGKSTMAQALVRHLPSNASIPTGKALLDGEDILEMTDDRLREIRWDKVAYIPQNAMNALDPVFTIKRQLVEPIVAHTDKTQSEAVERAKEVLDIVGIDPSRINEYPHQFSGGMKQRIVVAMAMVLEPQLIIADEPTTGLDVLMRDKILNDLERFRDDFDVSIIMISHDIADLVETSDKLMVMYGGKIVEIGDSRDMFSEPTHPYTIGLRNALPNVNSNLDDLIAMEMDPPDLRNPPSGCCFVERCPYAKPECHEEHPSFYEPRSGIETACYRADEATIMREQARSVEWSEEAIGD